MTFVKKRLGFTMIELLCVLVIIGTLGSSAVAQFVDFRNEARKASLVSTLASMRVALKLQFQQARLKCNYTGIDYVGLSLMPFYYLASASMVNDITGSGWPLCTTAQVPNQADRLFYSNLAQNSFPRNPFSSFAQTGNYLLISPANLTTFYGGSRCNVANAFTSSLVEWGFVNDLNGIDVFALTNTAGINECSL